MTDSANFRKFWWLYGVDLAKTGNQLIGNCPFCNNDQHYFVDPRTSTWDCKSCGESGNSYTFLTKLHDISLSSPEDLAELSSNRGIKVETLQFVGAKKSVISGGYILPVKNDRGSVINLYRTEKTDDGKYPVLSAPAPCKQQLYLSDKRRKNQTVYICEGHWDAIIWTETLLHLQQRGEKIVKKGKPNPKTSLYASYDVVGAPGASTFAEEWLKGLKNCDIILLYDNDEPGRKGMKRLIKMIQESNVNINSIHKIEWRSDDPNDIRDLVNRDGYLKSFEYVKDLLVEVPVDPTDDEDEDIEPVKCDTFSELLGYYDLQLLMTESIRDTLAAMIAMAISVAPEGAQLGLRVIGPPGSAKSTLAEAVSGCRSLVYPTSKFTGLISGFPTIKKSQQIANQMNNKNVIIKDADVMMQLPNKRQIESEIRDALGDGVIRANYRTGKNEVLYTNFSMTQCGTFALKEMDDSQLGSRFVDIIIVDKEANKKDVARAAILSEISRSYKSVPGGKGKSGNNILAGPTAGFTMSKHQQVEECDEEIEVSSLRVDQLLAMGELIVWSRATVSRENKDELKARPETEWPTRVSTQLAKLAKMVALVLSEDSNKIGVNRRTMQVMQRICKDTCYGFHFEIMEALYNLPEGMTAEQIGWKLSLGPTQARKHCIDLVELDILARKKVKHNYGKGRKAHYYVLTEDVRTSFKTAFSKR